MRARPGEFDDVAVRQFVCVRRSSATTLSYDVSVLGVDTADVVRFAGGWICDRLRAGWRVNVLVPEGCDTRPLQILGAGWAPFDTAYAAARLSSPAALAVSAEVVAGNERVLRDVRKALARKRTEVNLWGDVTPADGDLLVAHARHRLSAVAMAYKTQAMIAVLGKHSEVAPFEEFRSAGLWYPADGSDLAPIS